MALSIGELFGTLTITGASEAVRDLTRVQASFTETGATAERAGVGVETASAALMGAGRSAAVASTGSAKLRAAQLSAVAATERYNLVLADENASLGRLASTEASVIRANERVKASSPAASMRTTGVAATESSTMMGRAGASMGSFGLMAAKLGLFFGVFALAKKALDVGKEASAFQRQMLLIQTQAGASSSEVRHMSKDLLGLAGDVATAPEKLAVSLYHVESTGMRTTQALQAVRIAAEGAKVGHADLEQTTNALTAAIISGIPGVRNMGQAMGALNAIVGTGDMKLSDLNDAMSTGILKTAKEFGLSLTDVGAALADFGDNNIRGAAAATMLRMSIIAMAQPVAGGAKVLASLGMTSKQLGVDMQTGGLNKALVDLKTHMTAAGITGSKVGAVLTGAFGKKAGPGMAILIDDLTRVQSKMKAIADGAGRFGSDWTATTHTASFVFARLGAEVSAAAISVMNKLLPAASQAGAMLGTTLPHAIATVIDIVKPLAQEVGVVLGGAWHVLAGVLSVAATVLGAVGRAAHAMRGPITDLATAVGFLWVVFKGYAVAQLAFRAIAVGAGIAVTRVMALREAFLAVAAGEEVASLGATALGFAAIGVGVYAAGKALDSWIHSGDSTVRVLSGLKTAESDWTSALEASNGALTDGIRLSVAKQLQDSGLAAKAAAAGVSLRQMTDATVGGQSAMNDLIKTWKAGGKPNNDTLFAFIQLAQGFSLSAKNAKDLGLAVGPLKGKVAAAAAGAQDLGKSMQWTVDAAGNVTQSMLANGKATDTATAAMAAQTQASKLLKSALDILNGVNLTAEQSMNAAADARNTFTDAVRAAIKAHDKGATSIARDTEAGLKNRENLVSWIEAAKASAQAQADQAAKTKGVTVALNIGNASLVAQEGKIRAVAKALGISTPMVDALIKSIGKLDTVKAAPKIDVLTGPAKAKADELQRDINNIRQGRVPGLSVYSQAARDQIARLQAQIDNLHGKTLIINTIAANYATATARGSADGGQIRGPGTGTSDSVLMYGSDGEFVVRASQTAKHLPLLKAINDGTQGFAAGGMVHGYAAGGKITASTEAGLLGTTSGAILSFAATLTGAGANIAAAAATLFHDALAAHISQGTLNRVTRDRAAVLAYATARDRVRAALGTPASNTTTAYDRLAAAQGNYQGERSSVAATAFGSFDVTTAGNGYNGQQPITGGSILAQAKQAANRVKVFAADLTKLNGHINAPYLRSLAEKGPDALPEVQALLTLSSAQMKELNTTEAGMASSSAGLGSMVASSLYGGSVRSAQATVDRDKKLIAAYTHSIDHLGTVLATTLDKAVVQAGGKDITINIDGKVVHRVSTTAAKKLARRN